ncbi:hypothetical protein T458_09710 [Brevibacillus panacihumi W25]|uniref:Uncharacterized protein n=1 Tax=Brevibacillus panacihumi W25 TaxID=1408254 RepID=V6M977_9BACL|nr:hypothetical protein T458_09710 [Brevibacillus panacihumi W25]
MIFIVLKWKKVKKGVYLFMRLPMLKSFNSIRLMSIVFIATLVTNGFIIKDALAGVGDSPLVTKQKCVTVK